MVSLLEEFETVDVLLEVTIYRRLLQILKSAQQVHEKWICRRIFRMLLQMSHLQARSMLEASGSIRYASSLDVRGIR
jgi:hypothetical protein